MSRRVVEAILRMSTKVGSLRGFDKMSQKFGEVEARARRFNRTQKRLAGASALLQRRLMAGIAPAAIAYGTQKVYREYAGLERTMSRIRLTAEASGEQMAEALDIVRATAQDTFTPVDNIVMALDGLVASGKTLEESLALLPSVAAAAQAAGSDFGDMATTAEALQGALKISAFEMQNAFDILAAGGKMGKFELKDMAAELPSLAPAFAALGYEGEEGLKRLTAALQTVRRATGTSGEAATAFMDVLSKMEVQTTANNFKRMGMDLRKEMKKIRASGEDVLEGFIRLSKEAVDGNLTKLPQLFTDKQMLIAMRALINETDDYRAAIVSLGNAAGTTNADLQVLAKDSQASIDKMANSWVNFKESLGKGIAPQANAAADGTSGFLDGVSDYLDKEMAVSKVLTESGLSMPERILEINRLRLFDGEQYDKLAQEGGYRTDAQKQATKLAPEYAKMVYDKHASPQIGPSPLPVPISRYDADVMAGKIIPDFPPMPDYSHEEIRPGKAATRRAQASRGSSSEVDFNSLLADVKNMFGLGGEKAAREIEQGASQSGSEFGRTATQEISNGASQAGAQFGDAAAARILQAADSAAQKMSGAQLRKHNRDSRGVNVTNPSTMADAGTATP